MTFKTYDKGKLQGGRRNAVTYPTVTLGRMQMHINSVAHQLLGHPKKVYIMYDPSRRLIGISKALPHDSKALTAAAAGRDKGQYGRSISAIGFYKTFDIEPDRERRRGFMENGILCIPI